MDERDLRVEVCAIQLPRRVTESVSEEVILLFDLAFF